jgi:hypothetical protein
MFLLRRNNRNSDVIAICYVCYDITRKKIFDVKRKPYPFHLLFYLFFSFSPSLDVEKHWKIRAGGTHLSIHTRLSR